MPNWSFGSWEHFVFCVPRSACQRLPPFLAANAVTVPAAVAVMYSPPRLSAMKSGCAVTAASSGRDHASVSFGAVAAVIFESVATPSRVVELPHVDQSPRGGAACATAVSESTNVRTRRGRA